MNIKPKPLFIILFLFIIPSLLFTACMQKREHQAEQIKRDTTINQGNSFSELFLDSMRVEKFITDQKLEDNSALLMRNFYNSRNYQFAWFIPEGLTEQARAFWNLYNTYINYSRDSSLVNKSLNKQMELFIAEGIKNIPGKEIIQTELQLTNRFFKYAHYAYAGRIDPRDLQWFIPRKKVDAIALLDSLIASKGKNLEEWEPVNHQYKLIKKELLHYYEIEKNGGWRELSFSKNRKYKQGDSLLFIAKLKQRLKVAGDYIDEDSSLRFGPELAAAVKQAQKRFGLKQNGIADTALISQLNISVKDRIEQLLINMERMRWMPLESTGNRLLVNIPEFKLYVYEKGEKAFDMDIVVGKEVNQTIIFNDTLKYIVFSPYWNVPSSIVRNEILPAMRRNPNYLANKNMEQIGGSTDLPAIRQKPGSGNPLGKVKFIFPNNYAIYFHDTPAQSYFKRDQRAFSHGCIRLAEPKKLAEYLLRHRPDWASLKIDEAMNAAEEKWINLKEPVPVFISYFTAWVDQDGLLNFRKDIYGHDSKMSRRLFHPEEDTWLFKAVP
ncbi:MAG: L,D-transpeptidase family protein [Daejeonella sp.]